MTLERTIHFEYSSRRVKVRKGEPKNIPNRQSELMAFAIIFDDWLKIGKAESLSHLRDITGLSRPEISRIMALRLKPPHNQERLLAML